MEYDKRMQLNSSKVGHLKNHYHTIMKVADRITLPREDGCNR